MRETKHHVAAESKLQGELPPDGIPTQREIFWRTSVRDRNLSSVTQAGLVNNLNDGMAWGLVREGIFRYDPQSGGAALVAKSPRPVTAGFALMERRLYFASGAVIYRYRLP